MRGGRYAAAMDTPGKKPALPATATTFGNADGDDDDDLTELDALAPMEGLTEGSQQTRVASMDNVSKKTAATRDQERARALNISMARWVIPAFWILFISLASSLLISG